MTWKQLDLLLGYIFFPFCFPVLLFIWDHKLCHKYWQYMLAEKLSLPAEEKQSPHFIQVEGLDTATRQSDFFLTHIQ